LVQVSLEALDQLPSCSVCGTTTEIGKMRITCMALLCREDLEVGVAQSSYDLVHRLLGSGQLD